MNARTSTICALAAIFVLTACQRETEPNKSEEGVAEVKSESRNDSERRRASKRKQQENTRYLTIVPRPPSDKRGKGFHQEQLRVVGGRPAKAGDFPFATPLLADAGEGEWYQFCGATPISPTWLVSAAHCDARKGDVAAPGSLNLNEIEAPIKIKRVVSHPGYDEGVAPQFDNDIALIELEEEWTGPVAKVVDATPGAGTDVVVIGWGATHSGGTTQNRLRFAEFDILDFGGCQLAYGDQPGSEPPTPSISERMLCAAGPSKDSCQGDSGGPLLANVGEDNVLLGIVSWGYGCADPQFPGVYTDAADYREWITKTTGGS
ncbi:MAG: serine protease [Myxococcota bacterium]